jgi:hypothetical protein
MPPGSLTICAEPSAVRNALVARLGLNQTSGDADVEVSEGPPTGPATHVVVTGPLDDAIDTWDSEVAPQTVAGALWLPPGQPDAPEAASAWLALRLQMPTTPLSDLTDNNGRALRWSVVSARVVAFPGSQAVEVDQEAVKAWVDAQPGVVDLGEAVQRIGGETADAVLSSATRLHAALAALVPLGATSSMASELDRAVAEHLRQVQRSGFARWRGAKARAESLAALRQAARAVAASRLTEVIEAREQQVTAETRSTLDAGLETSLRESIQEATSALELPVQPDFDKVPRSWASGAPQPRRYVFVNEEHLPLLENLEVTVRAADLPPNEALCAIVASGFSLSALR